jgi:hypothetical protein
MRPALLAAPLLAALATGCGRIDLPTPGFGPGPAKGLVDRVWASTDADAPEGAIIAFLSDGTLLMTSCGETYRLAPWRRVDDVTLVWEEDGVQIRAEIAALGGDALALVIDPEGAALGRSYERLRAPVVCPDAR